MFPSLPFTFLSGPITTDGAENQLGGDAIVEEDITIHVNCSDLFIPHIEREHLVNICALKSYTFLFLN